MRSKARSAAGVVVALLALALAFGFTYSLLSEYGGFGSSPGDDVASYGLVGVVVGPILALGIWLVFRRGLWALAGGLVLTLAAAVTGGMLGEAAHDRAHRVRTAACSPDERSEFQALGTVPNNGEHGWGNEDGSCRGLFGGRTRSSLDEFRQLIEGRGWKPDGSETYVREGKRLRIQVTDEGEKGLDIILVFP